MKFDFKRSDLVTCRITRRTKFAGEMVYPGDIVEVLGNVAMQGMSGAVPYLEKVDGDDSVRPYNENPTERIIETREPEIETRDPVIKETPKTTPARKTKPKSRQDKGNADS